MQFRRSLPGAGSTDFYLTDPEKGGLSEEQQRYVADLVMEYRRKYPKLTINAVWDFGMEEGDPVQSEKFGVFEDSRDNAVYNAKMLTVSINHARVRKMRCEADRDEIAEIEQYYDGLRDLPERAALMQSQMLAGGVPWPQIDGKIREELGLKACAENLLPVTDPYFADVQAIRMLENTESIQRLLIHEIGHMLSEESGAVSHKKVKKLFGRCRDGFENLYEFCAECFMASELTDKIRLAEEYKKILFAVM